ncbi:5-formyltetrahydrofolate cyclo-ligase [Streptomyces sp. NBC_01808]|uniref:5-formyltetrahydrofolate cyclo-ligase n=1 Tax=Streptomyces sp. NBC_01808 TaxID=2975947 RepID=UPI002DDB2E4C|nr:5-formyltetrahydrofolate cyclo-ligase [Streptomyces sp. NBC_01808]WSA38303.1 5-formyltetrahydrofolate cyclo-ligase [Streptomyces sp. NBC_01808]
MGSDQARKAALRRTLLAARAAVPRGEAEAAARRLARRALELPELAWARTVAAYVSVGREPGTRELLEALRERGTAVLLPVLLPDDDLDWAEYGGPETLRPAGRGLLEPAGPRLGPEAVRAADAVLLPGLAVDGRGLRLGRGGGSYDRVLARLAGGVDGGGVGGGGVGGGGVGGGVPDGTGPAGAQRTGVSPRRTGADTGAPPAGAPSAAGPALVVLLYDGEVLDHVPAEPHDRPVTAAVTPSAVRRFPPP